MRELTNYINDPENPECNFALALWYEAKGHITAAAGFYIRTAEYSTDDLFCYEALLRLANGFIRQGGRVYMTKGILLRAISLKPERPEAYFLLSRLYEVNKDWHEAYSFAVMGQRTDEDLPKLRTDVDYPGKYALIFEQAVAAWWIGLWDESVRLLKQLQVTAMLPIYHTAVKKNLENIC
jgi:tetratricopeptide (TPR) repeat protein